MCIKYVQYKRYIILFYKYMVQPIKCHLLDGKYYLLAYVINKDND